MRGVIILVALVGAFPAWASAQIIPPQQPGQQAPQPEDTIKVEPFRFDPPVSPLGAALRSLVLPGWGQSIMGRRVTGAAFIFWEGITLTMTLKSAHQLEYQKRIGAETVDDKRQELQDWAVLLAFNHVLAATEAYVATHLWDFPADLGLQVLPGGEIGMGARIEF